MAPEAVGLGIDSDVTRACGDAFASQIGEQALAAGSEADVDLPADAARIDDSRGRRDIVSAQTCQRRLVTDLRAARDLGVGDPFV